MLMRSRVEEGSPGVTVDSGSHYLKIRFIEARTNDLSDIECGYPRAVSETEVDRV